jgi:hypothetical protein
MYKVVKVDLCRAAIGIWDITSLALARWRKKSYAKLHSTLLPYSKTLLTVTNVSPMGEETLAMGKETLVYFWWREKALLVQPPILTTFVALRLQLSPFLKKSTVRTAWLSQNKVVQHRKYQFIVMQANSAPQVHYNPFHFNSRSLTPKTSITN